MKTLLGVWLTLYFFKQNSCESSKRTLEMEVICNRISMHGEEPANPVLSVAVHMLHWQKFTILCRNLAASGSLNNIYQFGIELLELDDFFMFIPCSLNGTDSPCERRNFICFLEPEEFYSLVQKMPNFRSHSWLIMSSLNRREWENTMNSLGLDFESEIFLGSIVSSDQYFAEVYEFYKIHTNYPLKVQKLGVVSMNGSLIGTKYLDYKYQRRKNLENIKIKLVGLDIATFILTTHKGVDGEQHPVGGLLGETFLIICQELNASYSLQILNGYKFGAFRNGSWDGMIGLLSRNEVDMSCSEISMASDRLSYIDFTNSFMTIGRRIYIRKTLDKKVINWSFFANPFSRFLLVSVALCFSGLVGVLWFINKYHQGRTDDLENIHEVSWIVLCALCQKGAPFVPSSRSGKIVFAIIYVTFLIIYSSYSATLTSQLSFAPPVQLPFEDLNGLLKSKGWSGGPIKGDLTQIYMEKTCPEIIAKSSDGANVACELLVQIWDKIVAPKVKELPLNFKEGLAKVLKERFAFVATSFGARNEINNGLSENNVCNVHELDGDHLSSNLALGLRKNFPYKGLINYKLLQLQQTGVLSRLKNFWLPQLNKGCDATLEKFIQISISDFGFAPILVFLGLVISSFIFIVENLLATVARHNEFHLHNIVF